MRVAVIGGGASGLVTLKYLITAHEFHDNEPIEAMLFESRDSISGTFKYRVYEDAELVSSKYLTAFSDFRCPRDDPDFLSTSRFCSYLEAYATHFKLWPHIRLSTTVEKVTRREGCGHLIRYIENDVSNEWECDAVAVCTGLHVEPWIPHINGIENVPTVLHSSQFKARKDFGIGKNVMVLGVGETAMDVSHLAVTSPTKTVTLCHRDGFFYAPKVVPVPVLLKYFGKSPAAQRNVPIDTYVMSLFDTAYVHPWLQKSMLIWDYYDLFAKRMSQVISGTVQGYDQWIGGISEDRFHVSSIFFCKSGKAVPYISKPYRKQGFLERFRAFLINMPIPETGDRQIDLASWPESISSDGIVTFRENGRPEADTMRKTVCKPDIVVFATGYSPKFHFLDESYEDASHADHRGIWRSGDKTVGFIGFVRPALGAIPPLSELQAQLWVLSILGRLPKEVPRDIDYRLRFKPGRRDYEIFGVDHEAYAYQLALDMDSAPSFTNVIRHGYRTTFTWAFGSNFNTKFRLVGPWKWDGAKEIMSTELYDVVNNSGGWVCLTFYSIIPFVLFGLMSAILWLTCDAIKFLRDVCGSIKASMTRTRKTIKPS